MKDMAKRRQVMGRSIQLGHCVCDVKKPCPCPTFREKDLCLCAGERDEGVALAEVRLTERARHAGCASKIGQRDLQEALAGLPPVRDPRVLVGLATGDDAGVFRLNEATTLVQTVDIFTPNVDDPYDFGRVAACNSLSDVYAMGGQPVTALSVVAFPAHTLPLAALTRMLCGGQAVLEEAGVVLLGGHSVDDEEVKFGYAVTGLVDPARMVTNAGARPGDALLLTKPLGTGVIALAHQLGRADEGARRAMLGAMTTLNRGAAEIMVRHGAHAATDVTGFGLLGHLARMARESGVTAELWFDRVPLLPRALEYARAGMYSGATERNAGYSQDCTDWAASLAVHERALLLDAQTSGGLLMALPAGAADAALRDLRGAGLADAQIMGRVVEPSDGRIRVRAGQEK